MGVPGEGKFVRSAVGVVFSSSFSSLAKILGECAIIHSPYELFVFFLLDIF